MLRMSTSAMASVLVVTMPAMLRSLEQDNGRGYGYVVQMSTSVVALAMASAMPVMVVGPMRRCHGLSPDAYRCGGLGVDAGGHQIRLEF